MMSGRHSAVELPGCLRVSIVSNSSTVAPSTSMDDPCVKLATTDSGAAMLQFDQFRRERLLASAFVFRDELRADKFLAQLLERFSPVYGGQPVSIPLPPEAPPEIPSVILTSTDGSQRMDISRARVNVARLLKDASPGDDLQPIISELADRLSLVAEVTGVTIGRLGVVLVSQLAVATPGKVLAEQFCRDELLRGPLNRPEGFELHAHKTFELLPGIDVNSWVRVKSAMSGAGEYDHVVVEQDINTLATELPTREFSRDETARIFGKAAIQLQAILELYFPKPGRKGPR